MSNGVNGFNPKDLHPDAEALLVQGFLVPIGVTVKIGTSVNPEIDGATIATVSFECKQMGMGEDQPSKHIDMVMPGESFLELSTVFGRYALGMLLKEV